MRSVNKDIEPDLGSTTETELQTLNEEWKTGKLQALSGYLLDPQRAEETKLSLQQTGTRMWRPRNTKGREFPQNLSHALAAWKRGVPARIE